MLGVGGGAVLNEGDGGVAHAVERGKNRVLGREGIDDMMMGGRVREEE